MMSSINGSIDGSVVVKTTPKVKTLPPFVLPDSDLIVRLKYFTASSNVHKWDETNVNPKTRKFLSRNGFHLLFWSAILIDDSIMSLIKVVFKDNILYINDNQFEDMFGVKLDPKLDISVDQLLANYFLLFSLPAKSHTQYVKEWAKRRLNAFSATLGHQNLTFDCHQELFVDTKRRFYVYKQLVPALTRFAITSFDNSSGLLRELFRQIKLSISYAGLQVFWLSWRYCGHPYTEAFDLDSVKEDIQRITVARNDIISKYGEEMLPFSRLLNYPEVSQLNRHHFPDLAVCALFCYREDSPSLANLKFRRIQTKTPLSQLRRLATTFKEEAFNGQSIRVFSDEEKEILMSLGVFPNEMLNSLTTFVNPYQHLLNDSFDF